MSAAVIASISVMGLLVVGVVAYIWKRRSKGGGGLADAASPLLGKTHDNKKETVGMQLLQKQINSLRIAHEKVEPQHNRLVQQDLVNRKIFEQLNNQQKNINEVISSQDRILRDQLQKIDLIERQEECLIEKVDEFVKEIVAETAKEIHNETEYHHYRHRKLQQTLLQQAAQRSAGVVDVKAVEEQLAALKTMFQRQQEDRQSLVATLTAVNNTSGSRFGGVAPSPPAAALPSQSPSPESSNPASPVYLSSVVQTSLQPTGTHPGEYHKKKHPSAPFQVKKKNSSKPSSATFPYPTVDFNEFDVNIPMHLSPSATDVAAKLLPTPASTGLAPSYPPPVPAVPPAIKAKQKRDAKKEQPITITKQDSSATEDWWKGLVSTSATALRPSATFKSDQLTAENAVARAENIPDGVLRSRKSSFAEPPPLPPLSVDSNSESIPLSPESDDDDDLAYTKLPTKITMQEV